MQVDSPSNAPSRPAHGTGIVLAVSFADHPGYSIGLMQLAMAVAGAALDP